MQGHVRLKPEVRALLQHLVERWHGLARNQRNSDHARLHQPAGGLVRILQAQGPPDTGGLKTEAEALNCVRLMACGMA